MCGRARGGNESEARVRRGEGASDGGDMMGGLLVTEMEGVENAQLEKTPATERRESLQRGGH